MELMSKRKSSFSNFFTSKRINLLAMSFIFSAFLMITPTLADDALSTAQNLLSKGAIAGGGLWAVWGLVQLGMSVKDNNGPGIQGAIWQIIGGAIIIAAGTAVATLNLTLS